MLITTLSAPGAAAQTPVPAHHSDGGFRNPYLSEELSRSRFFSYVHMRFFGGEPFAEYAGQGHRVPQVKADLNAIDDPSADTLQVTWIGHSTALLQYGGINVLTDPILSDRASPVGFAGPRRFTPPALRNANLPDIDYVVISHNHYDHLDHPTVAELANRVTWLVPLKLKQWFLDEGIDNVVELDWWQTKSFGRASFTSTPTQHFSGRTPWDFTETLWVSWAISIGDKRIWFGGDTGYNDTQFKRIGREYGPFDLGLIPIGAFEPRWFMQSMHANPAEAVLIHQDIGARTSIGVHWGTFQLSAEEIDQPMLELRHAAGAAEVDFKTIAIGETAKIE